MPADPKSGSLGTLPMWGLPAAAPYRAVRTDAVRSIRAAGRKRNPRCASSRGWRWCPNTSVVNRKGGPARFLLIFRDQFRTAENRMAHRLTRREFGIGAGAATLAAH